MYTLQLTDGTLIEGLSRLNPSTFEVNLEVALNRQLNDNNLLIAILLDEDGILADVFLDYTLQSCVQDCEKFHFRIASIAELEAAERHREEKERERRWKKRKH